MSPTLKKGEYAVFKTFDYSYEKNDIVAFRSPENGNIYIRRIMAVPENNVLISDGKIHIGDDVYQADGEKKVLSVKLKDDEFFLLADNRVGAQAADSFDYFIARQKDILGVYWFSWSGF